MSVPTIALRVTVPALSLNKTGSYRLTDTLWNAKLDITNKVLDASKGKIDFFNWGFIEPRSVKKNVFFLEECRDWASYEFASEIQLEFRLKYKVSDLTDKEYNKINTKKTQKKFLDYLDAKQYEKLKEEFNRGFDPNFISETGQTPLSLAVLVDDKLQLSTLVDNGALVDFRSADSKTPLHIAAANNKLVALQTLLYYGAWPDCLDAVTLPPLYYAATNGHSDCLHKLCQAKAGLNIIDSGGKTALHQACLGKWLPCVALLIDYGADMNIQNNTGNTALHICASVNAVECAQKLLIRGANKDIINKAGQTPLQFAIIMQSFDIVKFIQKFTLDQIIPPPPPMDSLYLTFRKDERKRVGTLKAPTITSSPSSTVASPNVGSADFHGSNERKSAPPPSLVNMSIFSSTQPPHTASPLSQRDARPISMIDPRSGGYNTGTEMLLPPPLGMFPVDIPGDTIGGGGVALPPLPPPPMFGGDQIAFDPSLLPPPPPTGLPDQFLFQDGNTNFPPPLALPSGIPPMFISAPPPPLPSGYGNDASMQFLPPPPQPNPSETAFDPYSMPFPPPPLPQQQQQQNTVPSHKSAPPPPMLNLDTTSQYGNAPPQPSVVPHDSAAKSNVIVNIISAMSTDAKELLQGLVIENKKMQQEITRLKAKLADMGIREY